MSRRRCWIRSVADHRGWRRRVGDSDRGSGLPRLRKRQLLLSAGSQDRVSQRPACRVQGEQRVRHVRRLLVGRGKLGRAGDPEQDLVECVQVPVDDEVLSDRAPGAASAWASRPGSVDSRSRVIEPMFALRFVLDWPRRLPLGGMQARDGRAQLAQGRLQERGGRRYWSRGCRWLLSVGKAGGLQRSYHARSASAASASAAAQTQQRQCRDAPLRRRVANVRELLSPAYAARLPPRTLRSPRTLYPCFPPCRSLILTCLGAGLTGGGGCVVQTARRKTYAERAPKRLSGSKHHAALENLLPAGLHPNG